MVNATLESEKSEVRGKKWRTPTSHFSFLTLLILAFIALCLVNNVALPIFEAPDESSHFIYANYIATEKRLPDLNGELPSHEVVQPPLYYALVALVIAPFDRSDLDALTKLNTDWFDKDLNADFTGVRGQHLRTDAERWPWGGAVWAVHAARFVSTLLGAATIGFVYLIGNEIFEQEKRDKKGGSNSSSPISYLLSLLPAILVAFNPKFIHVSSIVSNDIAITLACTVALWWLCRIEKGNRVRPKSSFSILNSQFSILGMLIGLAVLCKLQGLALFAPALLLLPTPLPSGERWGEGMPLLKRIADRAIPLLLGFALVAGWYFVYNIVRYGNPLAWVQVQAANATLFRQPPLDLAHIVATIPLWFTTYWGSLGVRLDYPAWVNAIFAVGLALAVIGCVVAMVRGLPIVANRRGLLLLIVAELAVLALFVAWLRSYIATENSRLIFPGIAPVAVLVVLGWSALTPKRLQRVLTVAVSAGMAALSIATPFTTILPAFATPDVLSRDQLVARYGLPNANGIATFGGDIRLVHAQLNTKRVNASDSIGVTLYWGAARPMNQSYRVLIEALDIDNTLIGRKLFIPFNGRFATQRWQTDAYFKDAYVLPIATTAQRGPAHIQLSIFAQYPTPSLLKIDGTNNTALQLGRIKVEATAIAEIDANAATIATFGDAIRLMQTRTRADHIQFDWIALKQLDQDYTLFVHVLDANGKMIGQQDAQPFGGQYPTGLWDVGERVRDVREIALPAEARQLRIGWYDASGARLPARKADGSLWPDGTVTIDIDRR